MVLAARDGPNPHARLQGELPQRARAEAHSIAALARLAELVGATPREERCAILSDRDEVLAARADRRSREVLGLVEVQGPRTEDLLDVPGGEAAGAVGAAGPEGAAARHQKGLLPSSGQLHKVRLAGGQPHFGGQRHAALGAGSRAAQALAGAVVAPSDDVEPRPGEAPTSLQRLRGGRMRGGPLHGLRRWGCGTWERRARNLS
mmetsp:Transcript_24999/g.80784  ORF Transcript_24999/g.80784 Transcript_24999/m.80784 type:complete len:204 (+) Transcript_24999:900-1511(+)